ncbi:MAG: aminopeptidase P family protein [Acidobacteria bacterium]|nr:aminopeptidase P family protein [Acidobacteriota bacterium]
MSTNSSQPDWPEIYRQRRNKIRRQVDGVILWIGHSLQPRNYAGNTYPFRQNSHFLYYTGLSEPDLLMLSFPEQDHDILFAREADIDDIVWTGPTRSRAELARDAGIDIAEEIERVKEHLAGVRSDGARIHYLPPYQYSSLYRAAQLLNMEPAEVIANVSQVLMEEVAKQRSIKTEVEIAEIEDALAITDLMHRAAMAEMGPGKRESEIAGVMQGIALAHDRQQAYNPIVTIRGEVLHNHSYSGIMQEGQLLLIDAGVESPLFYASDITRTFPVSGRFTAKQAGIYQIVLRMQLGTIGMIKSGISYRDVHLAACRIMAEGLRETGLMRGNPSDAIEAGAHALFFPHGIGHMLGLDVHDMEDLGDIVGYGKKEKRSGQFGLNYLRLSRPLEHGFVLTVEPGIYFIPALIERWQKENLHSEFIDYEKVNGYLGFGGIRIEDNILVTPTGATVLGPGIPKTIPEIESAMAQR